MAFYTHADLCAGVAGGGDLFGALTLNKISTMDLTTAAWLIGILRGSLHDLGRAGGGGLGDLFQGSC
jgi:hypothetical protein